MKKITKILLLMMPLVFVTIFTLGFTKNYNNINNQSSEIVLEVNTGRILYQKNAFDKKYMASTTKILTAICVIENFDIKKEVTVSKKTCNIEGSSIYLEEGEVLSIKDLLYGLMLRSGNDCAETLALECCGSIEKFSELMNKMALKIGASNSNFVNPHGLHNDNHYTTAYDLALISAYAIKNNTFKEIVSTKSIDIPFSTRNTKRRLINKNKMLSSYEGATGIKTGYTKKAGRCLVTSAERNGLELVSVVLNCAPMWQNSSNNLDYCFENYKNCKVLESDNIVDFYIGEKGDKIGAYVKNDIYVPLKENEINDVKINIEYNKNIKYPLKKDNEIGQVNIFVKNNLIFSEKIYNIVDIK